MKNIVLARVDDRLIHSEVVSVWTPSLQVNRIIIVDDEVAADKFNKRIIKALAPNGVKCNVYDTDVMGQKEWQKKECGKNIKKAGNAGIARDCKKKQKRIVILYGREKKGKQERKEEVKKMREIF